MKRYASFFPWILVGVLATVAISFSVWKTDPRSKNNGIVPPESEVVLPGLGDTAVFFQISRVMDFGKEPEAKDDTQETILYRLVVGKQGTPDFVTKVSFPSEQGSTISSLFGKDVLLHRSHGEETDTLVSVDGKTKEIPSQWKAIRSENGKIEVQWDIPDEFQKVVMTVIDVASEKEKEQVVIDPKELGSDFPIFPFGVSNDGAQIYVRGTVEASSNSFLNESNYWWVYETGKKVFRPLWNLENGSWPMTRHVEINRQTVIGVTARAPEFFGEEFQPPSTAVLLDLQKGTRKVLLESPEEVYEDIRLSPDGAFFAILVLEKDGSRVVSIRRIGDGKEIRREKATGILDWFLTDRFTDQDHSVLILAEGGAVRAVGGETGATMPLAENRGSYGDADYQYAEYVGHITLDE
ncbi:MAG TPA: hypothetical protein VJB99_04505 [Patescibacteria group bacterium]|nr:hypothetical protein [Patescibacteria group bacterium]